jgi:uncharacterized protein
MAKMKIAIIGSGISGLSAAYLLNENADITVYEKNEVIGGHSRTLEVNYDGVKIPIDTGFIVFNNRNYPHLTKLFETLGIAKTKSDMSFGASIDEGKLEWSAQSLFSVFGQRRNFFNPKFYSMLLDIYKFFRFAPQVLDRKDIITLGEYLDELKMGKCFREWFLLPMGAAIWSCPTSTMLEFPAQTFVRFFQNHGLLTVSDQPIWYTVTGGSKEYLKRLASSFVDKILTNCGVLSVKRNKESVSITDLNGNTQIYDRVIFACHANEAIALLDKPSEEEKLILGSFTYQENIAYLHRDKSLMPKRRNCWASWIYSRDSSKPENSIAVTYWMNNLQSIDNTKPVFVTLNPIKEPKPELTFDKHSFTHPIFTKAAIEAQEKIGSLQGVNNSWYCGAYTRYGFHEDGLLSAINVVKSMGVTIPWE